MREQACPCAANIWAALVSSDYRYIDMHEDNKNPNQISLIAKQPPSALAEHMFVEKGPAHEGINSYSTQEGINSKGNIIDI